MKTTIYNLREDSNRFFYAKRLLDATGVEDFAGGHFKKSVQNRFLTKQIFEIQLFFSVFKSPNSL